MKICVSKLDETEVRKAYPIADRVWGWFFRADEQSAGVCHVKGKDLWGHRVEYTGTDCEEALNRCVADAEAINAQRAAQPPEPQSR